MRLASFPTPPAGVQTLDLTGITNDRRRCVSARLPEPMTAALDALTAQYGVSRTRLVEEIILQHDTTIPFSVDDLVYAKLIDQKEALAATVRTPFSVHCHALVMDRLDEIMEKQKLKRSVTIRAVFARALASLAE